MKKKFSESSLKRILKEEKAFDINSLEKIIFEEAEKPAGESDVELIDSALDMLLEADGLEVPEISHEPHFQVKPAVVDRSRDRFFSYRVPKKWKSIASVCAALMVVIAANAVSTMAFGFNFTEELIKWTKKEVVISVEEATEEDKNSAYKEIVAQMAALGNWNFLLPEYLPQEMELVGYSVTPNEADVTVTVFLKSNTDEIVSIVSHNYVSREIMQQNSAVTIEGRYELGTKKTLGGYTVFEIQGEENNCALFKNDLSVYIVTTSYSDLELDKIVRGMIF